jgi:predicted SprT family Zn-dependent metalloprotease
VSDEPGLGPERALDPDLAELSMDVRATVATLSAELCAEHDIKPVPMLEWSKRMRRVLGRAYVHQHMIRLSVWLDERQVKDTLRHELAHIAAGMKRQAPHGERWQAWAVRLGVEPRATARAAPTNAPVRSSKRRYWGLVCHGCGLRLARTRVLPGLYHRTCGPRKGKLVKILRDEHDTVFEWIAAGRLAE